MREEEEEELVFGGGLVEPEEPAAPAPKPKAKPRAKTQAAPKAGAAAAPLKPVKVSDALLDAMMELDPDSDAYKRAILQFNTLRDQGN